MQSDQLNILLPDVVRIAEKAGEKIMEVYQAGFEVDIKTDNSPVTTADLAANEIIETELRKLTLSFPILSEESAPTPFEERKTRETYWLVDPLDGTKEFINRHDSFTVNIALIHQNKPILGVIYAPVLGVTYYASKGNGSYKEATAIDTKSTANKNALKSSQVSKERIFVRKIPSKAVFAVSRAHPGKNLSEFLKRFEKDHGEYELINMGSSLKMCMVAEGTVDLYPRLWGTSEWDTAAAHCIVEEAGGQLVKTDMSPLLYNTKDSLLNPYFFTIGRNSIDWMKYLPKALLD